MKVSSVPDVMNQCKSDNMMMRSIHYIRLLDLIIKTVKDKNKTHIYEICEAYNELCNSLGRQTIINHTQIEYIQRMEKEGFITLDKNKAKKIPDYIIYLTQKQRMKIEQFLLKNRKMPLSTFLKHNTYCVSTKDVTIRINNCSIE